MSVQKPLRLEITMQKLTSGYLIAKSILFILLNAIGICLSVMFLHVARDSALSPALARALAGGIGLLCYCVLQFRTIMGAKLDGISQKNYLLGESLTALFFLLITLISCVILGTDTLCEGFRTAPLLPFLPFTYLIGNLYLGTLSQLAFYTLFNFLCYKIKQKKDPLLLGRKKGGNNQ